LQATINGGNDDEDDDGDDNDDDDVDDDGDEDDDDDAGDDGVICAMTDMRRCCDEKAKRRSVCGVKSTVYNRRSVVRLSMIVDTSR
jgi:hypothetical protein